MTFHRVATRFLMLAGAAAALSACGAMSGMSSSSSGGGSAASAARAPQMAMLSATLSGAQEVPPNTTSGSGSAQVRFNKDTMELQYTVNYQGLTGPVTGAHIHGPAAAGANAPVVVPFANATASPITGTFKLNPTQAGDLQAGLYYVNIHTAAHPGGEIRGQLRLAP